MKVGLDTFSIRDLKLDEFGQLDWIKAHDLEGAQLGNMGQDSGKAREIRKHADSLGLYSHVSVSWPNPVLHTVSGDTLAETLTREIETAAQAGWHELHSALGSDQNRYRSPDTPWTQQVEASIQLLKNIAPVLRHCRSRINLETHFDTTTFELVEIIEKVGPDICGICLDTANVVLFGEHPLSAAKRAAPYTHLTHIKDAMLYFGPRGLMRQTFPPGRGQIDWPGLLEILAEYEPDLPLSIEDHKWLFGAEIFESGWHSEQRHLSREELAMTVGLAWEGQQGISSGRFPNPDDYENIPYLDELEDRLHAGRDHLKASIRRIKK